MLDILKALVALRLLAVTLMILVALGALGIWTISRGSVVVGVLVLGGLGASLSLLAAAAMRRLSR